jgi:Flp pilus assembly protein TadD
MGEKRFQSSARWERCERRQGAEALARLAGQLPEFFADSTLVSSSWSRLPFYADYRLMELRFARDHGVERAYLIHGPKRTWWLNGESGPIHEANEAESLALSQSMVCDYIRFFFYFLRGEEDGFVLIESAGEVGPRADADGWGDDEDGALEAANGRARPLRLRGVDAEGRWLVDATVAYGGGLFGASLAVSASGEVEMLDDDPIVELDALAVPAAPALELADATVPVATDRMADPPEQADGTRQPTTSGALGTAFEQSTQQTGSGEWFVGRTTEQDEFRRVLMLARTATGAPNDAHVVLVHGLGGIGKSTLLARLHEIAGASRRGGPVVARKPVDCEEQRLLNPADYAGPGGPPVGGLLDLLYTELLKSATGWRMREQVKKAFKEYRHTVAVQPELLTRASQLGIAPFGGGQMSGDQRSALGQTVVGTGKRIAAAAGVAVPHFAVPAAALLTTAEIAASKAKLWRDGPVDEAHYEALLTDLDRLVSQFAQGLKNLSRGNAPVVVFIDTAELLGEALEWLSVAAQRSGPRVVWVLGLRMEAESDEGPVSEAALFRGLHHTRLRRMHLTRFDDQTVEDYLRARLGDSYPAGLDITAVVQLTHGIPLAVSFVSKLLAKGQDPATALAPVRDGEVSSVIRVLAKRYLVHALNIPALREDLDLLYGLALLYGDIGQSWLPGGSPGGTPRGPDALATLWGVPVHTVSDRLDGLAARHDFVLSGSGRMHQEVREAVRLFLLDPNRRSGSVVRDMNARAEAWYRRQVTTGGHQTVDEQLADPGWQAAVVALLWHTFWIDSDKGLRLLKGLFTAAVTVDSSFAAALLGAAAFFRPTCGADGERLISDLQLVTGVQLTFRPAPDKRARAAGAARDVLNALQTCPAGPLLAAAPPAAAYYDLLRASFHEAFGLAPPDRAALLFRAASDVEPGGATAHAITAQVRDLAIDPTEYRNAPPASQQAIISALELLTRFDPEDAVAHHNLGTALFGLSRYPEAEAAYREAVRLDPSSPVYHYNYGSALSLLGRHAEAEAAYREALRITPSDAIANNNLGNALYELDQYDVAVAAYREARRLDPSEVVYCRNLGGALVGLERYTEAEAAFRDALRLAPGNADVHSYLGGALSFLGRYEEAEAAFREALRLDPSNVGYHNDLGNMLSFLGRYEEAEAAFREALLLDPSNVGYHRDLGNMLSSLGRYEEAEAAFREALRLDISDADAYSGLGYALAGLGRLAEAEAAYREMSRLNASDADAYNGLGYALAGLGRFAEAEAAYREALRLNPSFVNPCNNLGRLYLKLLGKVDDASVALREALRLDPSCVSAHANLASLYVVTGELDAARSSFLEATQSAPAKQAFAELMLGALDCSIDPPAAEGHFTAALTALDQPLQPTFMTPFERAEIQALAMAALDRDQEATAVFERAVSKRSRADVFQRQHYELFSVSRPNTGINALIKIWGDIITRDNSAVGP